MFWKCRRFANLQSVKQYCINKLQNLVVLTQWQRVHVSVRCAQSWRESHERRTHFLKTGVTIDLWVSDVIVYCSQLFMRSGKLKPWTTRIAYGQKCHVSESYKFKNNIKNLNQSIILFVNCPVYGFQKFSVSFKWTNFNPSQIIMQWMKHFEFRRFFLQVLSSKPQLIFYRSRYLRLPYFRLQEFRLIESETRQWSLPRDCFDTPTKASCKNALLTMTALCSVSHMKSDITSAFVLIYFDIDNFTRLEMFCEDRLVLSQIPVQ